MNKLTKNILYLSSLALAATFYSCDPSDDPTPDPTPGGSAPAIMLTCDYFDENPNATLVDNPDAPVDYIVPEGCNMNINDDVTVEPGVTIVFQTNSGMRVNAEGSLKMIGTANKMITLTGEDKVPGSWIGIAISSSDVKNEIAFTRVQYGGAGTISASNRPGNVRVNSNGLVKFHDNIVEYSSSWGLHVGNNTGAIGTATNINNNTFSNNNKAGLRLYIQTANELGVNNTYKGNSHDMVEIVGGEMGGITLKDIGAPYHFLNYNNSYFTNFGAFNINPGVEIVMDAGLSIDVKSTASFFAVGTADKPIKIRGLVPIKGYWKTIHILGTSPLNRIEYVDVRHAGNTDEGAFRFHPLSGSMYVANAHFELINGCALVHSSSNPNGIDEGPGITYSECDGTVCG